MKLLHRIIKYLLREFPESKHVFDTNQNRLSDLEIWEFALKNDFIIVTYDQDFYEWPLIRDCPPKIVWLRFGNAKTKVIAQKIIDQKASID